ncbi:MAG: lipid-A-disaccharide synthase [Proteobacteria bacterium]|nr:lipid-A-disaccharide synthase [Pseudomonadota bacterium]MBU4295658.1 lipid-A-disaccharide synthase [Pseudomonadota bacterium]MCG2746849.1 lipid-A-disaccharide synthase [Desulfobulbaceae bacterium]
MLRIMIVAGEASGDLHGAHLVAAMKQLAPDLSLCGMGGVELRRQGVDILYDAAKMAVVGLVEVIAHLKDIRAARNILADELRNNPPNLLILIDYPDFNLLLAQKARQFGIPIFYYISPQVWAWRSGRVKKIGRIIDRMAVILPFEKEFYQKRGVEVEYVGHPLLDSVRRTMERSDFCRLHQIKPDNILLGILPGSRKKEIRAMLPVFLETAARLRETHGNLTILLPLAPSLTMEDLLACGLDRQGLEIKVISEDRYDLMASCDLVIAASGTVTLELAILDVPMVVAYKVSPLTWLVGKMLVKVDYASLVNLIASREVVKELMQHEATPEKICAALQDILPGSVKRQEMLHDLAEVRRKLGGEGASMRAARLALATAS